MGLHTFKCLTCGGSLIMNHLVSTLCRDCHREKLAVPLYCDLCCKRENKCANCGSPIRNSSERTKSNG